MRTRTITKSKRRIVSAAGSVAVAVVGLVVLLAGPAAAATYYGTVEKSQSGDCYGELQGQFADSGSYYAAPNFSVNSWSSAQCHGWLDQSFDGGSSWNGLIGYGYFDASHFLIDGWYYDGGSSEMRICVQQVGDNTARCSGWW